MLLVRPPVSIFQQIVLPYLSTAAIPNHRRASSSSTTGVQLQARLSGCSRTLQTSAPLSRPTNVGVEVSRGSNQAIDWEPYEGRASSSRRRTREYLGLESRLKDGSLGANGEDAYMRTTALALERIIRSHSPVLLDKGKGKELAQVNDDPSRTEGEARSLARPTPDPALEKHRKHAGSRDPVQSPDPRSDSPVSETLRPATTFPPDDRPFPPLIHQLLQSRQFRLTTLHILNYPIYALDSALVHRVAGYMDRHGGQAAARRLRKGKIPSPTQRDTISQSGQDVLPRPAYPLNTDGLDGITPYIGSLSPQARVTSFYNTQLAQQLSASHLSKGFRPPKSFPLPNTSLRQLRALLARIHYLEYSKAFVPDRVTANLVLSCWVRSALAPPPDGVRVVQTRDKKWTTSPRHTGQNQDRFGKEEMRRLLGTVTRLFDRSARPVTIALECPSPGTSNSTSKECGENAGIEKQEDQGGDPDLSYSRHIKPFVRIFRHGFKQQHDRVGLDQLKEWDEGIKATLSHRREVGQ